MFDYRNVIDFTEVKYQERLVTYKNQWLYPQINLDVCAKIENHQWASLFQEFPYIELDKLLSLFGFAVFKSVLSCNLCGISVAISDYPTTPTNKISLDSRSSDDPQKFDLVKTHRFYCPYINDLTVTDLSYFTTSPRSLHIGWLLLLNKLTQNKPNVAYILKKTQEMIKSHKEIISNSNII